MLLGGVRRLASNLRFGRAVRSLNTLKNNDLRNEESREEVESQAGDNKKNFARAEKRKIRYLQSKEWCDKCIDVIEKKRGLQSNKFFCLVNPSRSILTKKILQLNSCNVAVWERSESDADSYRDLKSEFSEKFSFSSGNFNEKSVKSFCKDVVRRQNGVEKFVVLNHTLYPSPTLYYFMKHFFIDDAMWSVAPVELLMFLTKDECEGLSSSSSKQAGTRALCDLFMQHQVFLEIPSDAFNQEACRRMKGKRNSSYFLVNFSIQERLLTTSREDRLKCYDTAKFVRAMFKKSERVVPAVESIFGSVGLDLINEGVGMMHTPKDVPTHLWPKIHEVLTSNPDRQSCFSMFMSSLAKIKNRRIRTGRQADDSELIMHREIPY